MVADLLGEHQRREMTPTDFNLVPLLRGRRARAPIVRAPRQAPEWGLRARRAPTLAAWWQLSKEVGIVADAAVEVSWDLDGNRSTSVDHTAWPPVLGSLSEGRSSSALPTYAANIAPRSAFNTASRGSPKTSAHSRALGSTAPGTSPKQPDPGAASLSLPANAEAR
jgi:hypothetical protein